MTVLRLYDNVHLLSADATLMIPTRSPLFFPIRYIGPLPNIGIIGMPNIGTPKPIWQNFNRLVRKLGQHEPLIRHT